MTSAEDSSTNDRTPASDEIEVGAADRDLRYWLAKEAMRQGEARLTAQNAVRTALEARAAALTGWAAVGLLASSGASFTAKDDPAFLGATAAAVVLFLAASLGIYAARPRGWSMVGYEPDVVMGLSARFNTELEAVESISGGLIDGIAINNQRIAQTSRLLRWAGWLLIVAPVAGAVIYRARVAISW